MTSDSQSDAHSEGDEMSTIKIATTLAKESLLRFEGVAGAQTAYENRLLREFEFLSSQAYQAGMLRAAAICKERASDDELSTAYEAYNEIRAEVFIT